MASRVFRRFRQSKAEEINRRISAGGSLSQTCSEIDHDSDDGSGLSDDNESRAGQSIAGKVMDWMRRKSTRKSRKSANVGKKSFKMEREELDTVGASTFNREEYFQQYGLDSSIKDGISWFIEEISALPSTQVLKKELINTLMECTATERSYQDALAIYTRLRDMLLTDGWWTAARYYQDQMKEKENMKVQKAKAEQNLVDLKASSMREVVMLRDKIRNLPRGTSGVLETRYVNPLDHLPDNVRDVATDSVREALKCILSDTLDMKQGDLYSALREQLDEMRNELEVQKEALTQEAAELRENFGNQKKELEDHCNKLEKDNQDLTCKVQRLRKYAQKHARQVRILCANEDEAPEKNNMDMTVNMNDFAVKEFQEQKESKFRRKATIDDKLAWTQLERWSNYVNNPKSAMEVGDDPELADSQSIVDEDSVLPDASRQEDVPATEVVFPPATDLETAEAADSEVIQANVDKVSPAADDGRNYMMSEMPKQPSSKDEGGESVATASAPEPAPEPAPSARVTPSQDQGAGRGVAKAASLKRQQSNPPSKSTHARSGFMQEEAETKPKAPCRPQKLVGSSRTDGSALDPDDADQDAMLDSLLPSEPSSPQLLPHEKQPQQVPKEPRSPQHSSLPPSNAQHSQQPPVQQQKQQQPQPQQQSKAPPKANPKVAPKADRPRTPQAMPKAQQQEQQHQVHQSRPQQQPRQQQDEQLQPESPRANVKLQPKAQAKAQSKTQTESQPKGLPKVQPELQAEVRPEPQPKVQPKAPAGPDPKPQTNSRPKAQASPKQQQPAKAQLGAQSKLQQNAPSTAQLAATGAALRSHQKEEEEEEELHQQQREKEEEEEDKEEREYEQDQREEEEEQQLTPASKHLPELAPVSEVDMVDDEEEVATEELVTPKWEEHAHKSLSLFKVMGHLDLELDNGVLNDMLEACPQDLRESQVVKLLCWCMTLLHKEMQCVRSICSSMLSRVSAAPRYVDENGGQTVTLQLDYFAEFLSAQNSLLLRCFVKAQDAMKQLEELRVDQLEDSSVAGALKRSDNRATMKGGASPSNTRATLSSKKALRQKEIRPKSPQGTRPKSPNTDELLGVSVVRVGMGKDVAATSDSLITGSGLQGSAHAEASLTVTGSSKSSANSLAPAPSTAASVSSSPPRTPRMSTLSSASDLQQPAVIRLGSFTPSAKSKKTLTGAPGGQSSADGVAGRRHRPTTMLVTSAGVT